MVKELLVKSKLPNEIKIVALLLAKPLNKREITTKLKLSDKVIIDYIKSLIKKQLIKPQKISSNKYMTTINGIDYILGLTKEMWVDYIEEHTQAQISKIYKLKIMGDGGDIILEDYFLTKRKAKEEMKQIEIQIQTKFDDEQAWIEEKKIR